MGRRYRYYEKLKQKAAYKKRRKKRLKEAVKALKAAAAK